MLQIVGSTTFQLGVNSSTSLWQKPSLCGSARMISIIHTLGIVIPDSATLVHTMHDLANLGSRCAIHSSWKASGAENISKDSGANKFILILPQWVLPSRGKHCHGSMSYRQDFTRNVAPFPRLPGLKLTNSLLAGLPSSCRKG